ncbi:MAG: desulfoferrodoxin [Candidatus Margulisiibacteriota bacterium]|jgi:superoxide reductase
MTQKLEIYKCSICGNIIEVTHASVGELVCCGQPMQLMQENTVDASTEKHIPVIEDALNGMMVKIGAVPHPMEASHYIEWVEVITDKKVYCEYLELNGSPFCFFPINKSEVVSVRAYCNLHGLWQNKLQ